MTKFYMDSKPSLVGDAFVWQKKLVGKLCVTCDTLERASKRSKYTGEILREIRADGKHR